MSARLGHATNTAKPGHHTKLGRQAERLIQSLRRRAEGYNMKNISAALIACTLIAGCDASGDEPLTSKDVGLLASSCKTNGGMKQAERVRTLPGGREWRIDCIDGARFVLPDA